MAAEGYRRTGGEGQHAVLSVFLRHVGGGHFEQTAAYLDSARRLRNKTRYEKTGIVSEATALTAISRAQAFLAEARAWLAEQHPDLVPVTPGETAGAPESPPPDTS